jgi:hypothetical protein
MDGLEIVMFILQTEYAQSFAKEYENTVDDKIQEQVSRIAVLLHSKKPFTIE